jgi:hypothetical protein
LFFTKVDECLLAGHLFYGSFQQSLFSSGIENKTTVNELLIRFVEVILTKTPKKMP